MKLKIAPALVVLIAMLMFTANSNAFFNNDVEKAKEFMAAAMYPQAIQLLEKRINDKPTDATAHFQLGICYINTGNYNGADERFGSAVRIKPDYGYQIGKHYKATGSDALTRGNTGKAIMLFKKAVEFQPNLKKTIASECFDAGKSFLDNSQTYDADRVFSISRLYDSSHNVEIKELEVRYGRHLLKIAKGKSKKNREHYIEKAKKYLSQKEIDAVFPPPSWKIVFQKEYVGIGFTGGIYKDGGLPTAEFGKEILIGDKIIVIGNDIEVYNSGGWMKYKEPITNINGTKDFFDARAKKGKKFKIIVKRFM